MKKNARVESFTIADLKKQYITDGLCHLAGISIVLAGLLLSGCQSAPQPLIEKYPMSKIYEPQKPQFILNECGGVYDVQCMEKWASFFGEKLVDYYGQYPQSITVCNFNINLCMNSEVFEDHVRQYGSI